MMEHDDSDTMSPTTHSRYERLRNALLGGQDRTPRDSTPSWSEQEIPSSETSPLLRVMRNSFHDGSYQALPLKVDTSGRLHRHANSSFRPTMYAEQALGALLHGILVYVLCVILGLGMVALKFEGILGSSMNWWAVFAPVWIGNVVLIGAHIKSAQSAKRLAEWAEADSISNEPLLPLLRRIIFIYIISVPLTLLLLWSEVAFCARLNNYGTNLYVCFTPLLMIELAFIMRYVLCHSRSYLPGLCWILAFIFTALLAIQTDDRYQQFNKQKSSLQPQGPDVGQAAAPGTDSTLASWTPLVPLFSFDLVMIGCIVVVLGNMVMGFYRVQKWQMTLIVLYSSALILTMAGQFFLWVHLDANLTTYTLPMSFIFSGLVCGCIAVYIVARRYVTALMASRGGAVPIPLRRTEAGWVPSGTDVDRWLLLGDVELTRLVQQEKHGRGRYRGLSEIETDSSRYSFFSKIFCCGSADATVEMGNDTPINPEERVTSTLQRRISGAYEELNIDDIS